MSLRRHGGGGGDFYKLLDNDGGRLVGCLLIVHGVCKLFIVFFVNIFSTILRPHRQCIVALGLHGVPSI
jgi:hypothetical protein